MGKPRLVAEFRRVMRLNHFRLRTQQAYADSVTRFI